MSRGILMTNKHIRNVLKIANLPSAPPDTPAQIYRHIIRRQYAMKPKYINDMTKGSEFKLLVQFALPMLIGNLFQQLYNMVDSIIVGRYVGADALAAVGATGSLNFLFFSLCFGLTGGIGVIISQHFGAEDDENVRRTIFNSVYIIVTAGLLMSVLAVSLARPILTLLKTPANIINDSVAYMHIVGAGILGVASYNCVSSILRALGDSRTPLKFLILASLVNVILDLVFVVNLGMGVRGVGYATVISQAISALGSLIFAIRKNPYFKISRDEMRFDKTIVAKCYKLGVPLSLQSSLIALSCVALQSVVNSFGSVVVAAFTATSRVEQLVQQPYSSLSMALSTFTGQNMGAGKLDRVKRAFRQSFAIIAVFSLSMLMLFYTFGNDIMRVFVEDAEVIAFGSEAFKITAIFYLPLGMIYIVRGLLNGAGDATYSLINGCIEVAGRIIFSNTLIMIPSVGKWGVWLATALTWFITGIASFIRYRQGKWKTIRLVGNSSADPEPADDIEASHHRPAFFTSSHNIKHRRLMARS